MSAGTFELTMLGGPWGRRLRPRRAWIDELPWDEALPHDAVDARVVWTRTAFSEYASAAAFAEVAAALLAAGAPIDLVAAAGDFVVDEIVHTEAAARTAIALGGAVALEIDLERLVRPARAADPLIRAAEMVVRVSCVGEAMTVSMLKLSRRVAGSALIDAVLGRVIADESHHAQLGWWFLDWAEPRLDGDSRAHLGRTAGDALSAFAPILTPELTSVELSELRCQGFALSRSAVDFDGSLADTVGTPSDPQFARSGRHRRTVGPGGGCTASGLGALACDRYDPAFAAGARRVAGALAERGIDVPADDLAAVGAVAAPGATGPPG